MVGIGKKIDALAKQKDCEDAGLWRKSIVNHLYWVAATAPEGNEDMIEAMWKSVCNHIQDIHEEHSDLYPACAHGPLDEEERDKEWLQPCRKFWIFVLQKIVAISILFLYFHFNLQHQRFVKS